MVGKTVKHRNRVGIVVEFRTMTAPDTYQPQHINHVVKARFTDGDPEIFLVRGEFNTEAKIIEFK
jgi:hypothetical protein